MSEFWTEERLLMCVVHDAVIRPVSCGARRLAHFQLQFNEELLALLEEKVLELGCHMQVGLVYVDRGGNEGFVDFFVFSDEEVWDEFIDILHGRMAGVISKKDMNMRVGSLFGYSDESIDQYLKDNDGGRGDWDFSGKAMMSLNELKEVLMLGSVSEWITKYFKKKGRK